VVIIPIIPILQMKKPEAENLVQDYAGNEWQS
jgi:hypothetical protein